MLNLNVDTFRSALIIVLVAGLSFWLPAQDQEEVPKTPSNSFQGSETEFDYLDPPHGGKVVHTDKYHFEFVVDPFASEQKVTVYILNNKYRTRKPRKITATVKIALHDGTTVTKELIRKEDWFYCDLDDVVNPCNLVVYFKIRRKTFTGAHYYKGLKS